jgi:lysozyme
MILGIDVSENNSYIPWDALEAEGVKFCYVRCSYGKHGRDEKFLENVAQAHAHGMLVGAYHYDYSLSVDDAVENAKNCRKAIEEAGVLLELPVFYDMEDADNWKEEHGFTPDPGLVTSMCSVFGETIGLNWGVYASYSWLSDVIDWKGLGCPIWNAEWGPCDDIKGYVWQWTDNYNGYNIDGNYMYDENLFHNQE